MSKAKNLDAVGKAKARAIGGKVPKRFVTKGPTVGGPVRTK